MSFIYVVGGINRRRHSGGFFFYCFSTLSIKKSIRIDIRRIAGIRRTINIRMLREIWCKFRVYIITYYRRQGRFITITVIIIRVTRWKFVCALLRRVITRVRPNRRSPSNRYSIAKIRKRRFRQHRYTGPGNYNIFAINDEKTERESLSTRNRAIPYNYT